MVHLSGRPSTQAARTRAKPVIPGHENEITTFGYEFTAAAIERGAPDRPIMLFESPSFAPRTHAGGQARRPSRPAQGSDRSLDGRAAPLGARQAAQQRRDGGAAWDESDRCTTLPERFEFDLAPGTYDLFLAFDILGREAAGSTERATT